MEETRNITCPNCSYQFDVENVVADKVRRELEEQYKAERSELIESLNEQKRDLVENQKRFEDAKKKENELFQERLGKEIATEKERLKKSINEDYQLKINAQNEELEKKRKQVQELRVKEIEMERLKTKLLEQEQEIKLKLEKDMRVRMEEKEVKMVARLHEQNELKIKEKDKQLEDQKKLIEEMRRKSEQGSMQLQGEVQELAIEEFLQSHFPLDTIDEIKKGARGADCIQIVNTRNQSNCGKIYYESKRTKDFQPSWIEKFKADLRKEGADIGVLVTQALPKDMERMGNKDGIWICQFDEFKSLCFILRESIIKVNHVRESQANKADKVELLYQYLTGNEFRMQVEGIVEGFTQMSNDLTKEKNAMQRIWAQREKQIQKVLQNTTGMYGSVQGITGNAVPRIEQLELPGSEEELFSE